MRTIAISAATLLLLATGARADDILAAGGLFGSAAQKTGICSIYNGGSAAVTLATPHIYNEAGFSLPLTFNNCPASLSAGRICQVMATVGNLPYGCRTTVGPSKADVRGTFEVRDANFVVLQNIEMR
jgi:hypothetical protein